MASPQDKAADFSGYFSGQSKGTAPRPAPASSRNKKLYILILIIVVLAVIEAFLLKSNESITPQAPNGYHWTDPTKGPSKLVK